MRWLYLWSSYGELAGGGRSVGRYAGSWSYIPGSTRNRENEETTDNLRCMLYLVYAGLGVCCTWWMLYSVYAVLGVCCTRCMLYSVYAVLGVCCTRCMLHSVYAALSVNSWSWHGEIEMDDLTLCSCDDGKVVDKKVRDGRRRWECYGGYERLWEIRGMTWLIGFRRPRIVVVTRRIGTGIWCIGDGQLTRTRNSLSPSFSWWFPPSPLISVFVVLNSTIN